MTSDDVQNYWLFKDGSGCADPDYLAVEPDPSIAADFIHVVDKKNFDKLQHEYLSFRVEYVNKLNELHTNAQESRAALQDELVIEREKVRKLQEELDFTKEYLNPADTSFGQMMDTFRELPKERQEKLINLSRSLLELAQVGGES